MSEKTSVIFLPEFIRRKSLPEATLSPLETILSIHEVNISDNALVGADLNPIAARLNRQMAFPPTVGVGFARPDTSTIHLPEYYRAHSMRPYSE